MSDTIMTATNLASAFSEQFSHEAEGHVSAPGRVNLIGEFTDYNNGFVLPAALNFRTHALFSRRDDSLFEVRSLNFPGEVDRFDVTQPVAKGESQWGNYIRAVVFVLKRAGYNFSGMNILIHGNVPVGAGLSSSAALEVAVGGAISTAFELNISKQDLALLGQQAENDFMDCQCGIMDQLVSAKGEKNAALLIDCDSLETRPVAIPEHLSLVVIDSNHPHSLVDTEYNQRRIDCEQAAEKMGVANLRQANLELLMTHKADLSSNEFKRAHHVITENTRVHNTIQAFQDNDMNSLREQMEASHNSLRDDFEVTVPATDGLVEIVKAALAGRGAVRMTGGGFGGAIVALCEADDVAVIRAAVDAEYEKRFNLVAKVYVCHPDAGYDGY